MPNIEPNTGKGIEFMHMIKMISDGSQNLSVAGQFYSLAA